MDTEITDCWNRISQHWTDVESGNIPEIYTCDDMAKKMIAYIDRKDMPTAQEKRSKERAVELRENIEKMSKSTSQEGLQHHYMLLGKIGIKNAIKNLNAKIFAKCPACQNNNCVDMDVYAHNIASCGSNHKFYVSLEKDGRLKLTSALDQADLKKGDASIEDLGVEIRSKK